MDTGIILYKREFFFFSFSIIGTVARTQTWSHHYSKYTFYDLDVHYMLIINILFSNRTTYKDVSVG